MSSIIQKLFLWMSMTWMGCYGNFTSFNDSLVPITPVPSRCVEYLNLAASNLNMEPLGVDLLNVNKQSGKAFVYSDLTILHQLLQLFIIGSPVAKALIKNFLGLHLDAECENYFCESFNNLIETIKSNSSDVNYKSVFYLDPGHDENQSTKRCASTKVINFPEKLKHLFVRVNVDYRKIMEMPSAKCLERDIKLKTDFFMMQGFKLSTTTSGQTKVTGLRIPFTDIDGKETKIDWIRMTGQFWVVATILRTQEDREHYNCVLWRFRTEINDGRQYGLYFMVRFQGITDLDRKLECIQKVLVNLKRYAKETINKDLSARHIRRDPDFSNLLVPVMNFSTDATVDSLGSKMLGLFDENQISNLFNYKATLRELRSCEYFHNEQENTLELPVAKLTGEKNRNSTLHLSSPFVFTVVDRETGILLKTGVYLRP